MTEEQAALSERLRVALADEPVTREISMFGGRCFMVAERLAVCAMRGGALLLRVRGEDHDALLDRPGAAQAEMGRGRSMGVGWIEVGADAIADDAGLASWVAIAMAHNRTERVRA